MEYKGKLYGKVDKSYFPLLKTTDDFEALEKENKELKQKLEEAKYYLECIYDSESEYSFRDLAITAIRKIKENIPLNQM